MLGAAAGLRRQGDALRQLQNAARARHSFVFTGMGASYNACYPTINALAGRGTAAHLVSSAELLHFRRSLLHDDALVVVVSQSGESAEGVKLVRQCKEQSSAPIIVSVTNGLDNNIAMHSDIALDTGVGEEVGPSTMTFGAALVLLAAIDEVLGRAVADDAVRHVGLAAGEAAAAAGRLLAAPETWADELARWHGGRRDTVVLGRGPGRAASETGALLLKESAGMPAEALEVGQFRHGPLELAGPHLAVILVATEPETYELEVRLADELAGNGAAVLKITQGASGSAGTRLATTGYVDRRLLPAVSVIPMQLLSWRFAVDRGRTPGILTRAAKVTSRE